MRKLQKLVLLFIIISFLFLRFYHLEESLTVGTDQGMHLLEIHRLFHERKISLIGPVSSFTVYGRNFFFGPATYYLSMPFLALSNWNPFSVSYFMIFLQLAAFLILYRTLRRRFPKIALYYALIFTFSTTAINYSRFLWNPNLMIPASTLLLAVLISIKSKSHKALWFGVIGFLLGLGLQFHYSYVLAIMLTVIWLIVRKKLNLVSFISIVIGFAVGFFPIILFDLRHNFYNLSTIIQFVIVKFDKTNTSLVYTPGYIPEYYSFSILPFIYFFISLFLIKLREINRYLPLFLFAGYITFSLTKVLPVPSSGFISATDWNYYGVNKAKQIIIFENKEKYNIVDLLTGDTRAIYLRALLTLAGKKPMSIDEYPDSKYLFIYSRVPIDRLLAGSLWEMDVMRPLEVVKTWYLQNGIYLYLLKGAKATSYIKIWS